MSDTSLFATRIERSDLNDPTLLAELDAACWMIEDGDSAGHDWCEREGYPGYTSYASLDDLPMRAPAFADLVTALDVLATGFAARAHWDLGQAQLKCDSLWINILGEGGHHSGHIHPNSVISGTVYVSVPAGSGQIKFEDPRLPMMMAAPPVKADAPPSAKRFHYITPRAGEVLMWESWLRHEVMTSQSEEARMSVSFNYALV
ncbi:MAG: TIGR02466 family protein [Pseudomonadota bacterium]